LVQSTQNCNAVSRQRIHDVSLSTGWRSQTENWSLPPYFFALIE